jgi:hypothetical protein
MESKNESFVEWKSNETIALDWIPTDVWQYLIFPLLPISSLVPIHMVCKFWRILAQRSASVTSRNQEAILADLYQGKYSIKFLKWFESRLLFRLENMHDRVLYSCLEKAALGSFHLLIYLFSYYFLCQEESLVIVISYTFL